MGTNKPGQRIGQGMWIIFWSLVFLGLGNFFTEQEHQRNYPNETIVGKVSSQARQITLVANRYGHYTLTGKINNIPVRFLLDTGATEVVIPGVLADKLILPKGYKHRVRTANGEIDVYRTQIDLLELGPIRLNNVSASINPHMSGDVLLGMSALKALELNQKNGQLILTQSR